MAFLYSKIPSFFKSKKFQEYIVDVNKIHDGPPARYKLKPESVVLENQPDEEAKITRYTLGKCDPKHKNRTILLIGATGTGKSTLITTMVNFLMGVKFDDKVWFEIIEDEKKRPQSESQTSAVSIYEVYGFEGTVVPYSLTIIDTPGYGDTRGIEYDMKITKRLQDLFLADNGVDTIDVVCLVVKASENRLDDRMAYIFNSVTSIFGKNMQQNIVAMITHSDGMKPTNALQALCDAKVQLGKDDNNEPIYFLFNNRQKEKIGKDKDEEKAARNAFEIAEHGVSKFTKFLDNCQPQSLKPTMKVMTKRIQLKACIQNIKERIMLIEQKQTAIKNNQTELSKYREEIEKNQDFTMQVEETYKEREYINNLWDYKAVCCLECEETCHFPGCTLAKNPSWCRVMGKGKCTVCTKKCDAKHHVRENWRYVTKTRTVEKTKEELKRKYEKNKAKDKEKSSLLEGMEKELSDLETLKNQNLDEVFVLIEELEEIALNVESASTIVHLDFLIEKMKEKDDINKVQKLETIKSQIDERTKAGAHYWELQWNALHLN